MRDEATAAFRRDRIYRQLEELTSIRRDPLGSLADKCVQDKTDRATKRRKGVEKGSVPFSCRNPWPPSNGLANASPRHPGYRLAKLVISQRRTTLHASAYRMNFLGLQCTPEQFTRAKPSISKRVLTPFSFLRDQEPFMHA